MCATLRGLEILALLKQMLGNTHELIVSSFKEQQGEPQYYDSMARFCKKHGIVFFETKPGASIYGKYDLALMIHWRYMTPQAFIDALPLGAVVIHDSLLPKYRGFSPTAWAIADGQTECGATMFYPNKEMDCGDIIDQMRVEIKSTDTIKEVFEKVTDVYKKLVRNNIFDIILKTASRTPQNHTDATSRPKRKADDYKIDLSKSADEIIDLVRASVAPYPGAFIEANGRKMRIIKVRFET